MTRPRIPAPAILLLLCLLTAAASAQPSSPGHPPQARQFDFWLGDWDVNLRIRQEDLTWADAIAARARIYPVLGGKAVLELWESQPIVGYSLRYYDAAEREWVLWLNWPGKDRSGTQRLTGSFRHGRGEFFATRILPDSTERISRYTFSDISDSTLRWDDAFSTDGGRTWSHGWIMEFTRRDGAAQWPEPGGDIPTMNGDGRCSLPAFRRFDKLAGLWTGAMTWRLDDGSTTTVPLEMTAIPILQGCAVLQRLSWMTDGQIQRSLRIVTFNTYIGRYEELYLDGEPGRAVRMFYGAAAADSVVLTARGRAERGIGAARSVWRHPGGDHATLYLHHLRETAAGWQTTRRAVLRRTTP